MQNEQFLRALNIVSERMTGLPWTIYNGTSVLIRGVPVRENDIDIIVPDDITAKEANRRLLEYTVLAVDDYRGGKFIPAGYEVPSGQPKEGAFGSAYGVFDIESIKVEVIGGLEVYKHGEWQRDHMLWVTPQHVQFHQIKVPVPRLEQTVACYKNTARPKDYEKMHLIEQWTKNRSGYEIRESQPVTGAYPDLNNRPSWNFGEVLHDPVDSWQKGIQNHLAGAHLDTTEPLGKPEPAYMSQNTQLLESILNPQVHPE